MTTRTADTITGEIPSPTPGSPQWHELLQAHLVAARELLWARLQQGDYLYDDEPAAVASAYNSVRRALKLVTERLGQLKLPDPPPKEQAPLPIDTPVPNA